MLTKRCPYCHEEISVLKYDAHTAEHLKLQADGQQSEYVTLPPEQREDGNLDGVPRVYVHQKCGKMTGMPDEIIRSYLVNPYLYLADKSFCAGCGKHVPFRELAWTETGEDLQTYTDKLRDAKPEKRPMWPILALARFAKLFG